jgi:pantoate--beta-alanine ligase
MGCLHEGHLSLIHEGRRRADVLVVSIYVNPLQFGAGEDLERYPRAPEADAELCRAAGVDILFQPSAGDLYPDGFQTQVVVGPLGDGLCGASRPGHFAGVCTVVLKLFNLVRPRWAIFGSKDYQQLQVVRTMVRDFNLDIEVVGMPIVRESDGLAMSSRNAKLAASERHQACSLSAALSLAEQLFLAGERDPARLAERVRGLIEAQPLAEVDYISLADAHSLAPVVGPLHAPAVLALAVRFGTTRLIDNRVLVPRQSASTEASLGL